MTPTVFRAESFRFFFFSREEQRLHIHVESPRGEAKIWLDPEVELAKNHDPVAISRDEGLLRAGLAVIEACVVLQPRVKQAYHLAGESLEDPLDLNNGE